MSEDIPQKPQKTTAKSKKQLLLELLELDDEPLGDIGESKQLHKDEAQKETPKLDCIDGNDSITKPKKQLTEKQLEALRKGQQKRDENRERIKEEKKKKEEEEKRILEEKLVKKAIAVKKKQIKKQAVLEEISDDDTPIQKVKKIAEKIVEKENKPTGPKIIFV